MSDPNPISSPATTSPPTVHIEFPEHLPVSARREDIAAALNAHQVVIICGETGSGKTTQLPKIAWAAGRGQATQGKPGLIGMTQPRRIAAKSVASRIAEETRSRLGGFVGWQVRFHDHVGPDSRIKVMTDGILLAETQSDPELRAYDTLILDEAHERSLNIDFLLGYLKTLLPRRPELKLIISSATIEAERFSAYFNQAPVVEVSGRTYPVEIRWRPPAEGATAATANRAPSPPAPPPRGEGSEETDLEAAILAAVDELARAGPGDILIFLPGEREIRETEEALRKHHPPGTEILPLFARLSVSEQERVFQSHVGRRIVLSTNVAETSLTVPGIRYVVDAGQARVKRYSLRNKIEQLKIEPISQASANQRAGRCGRVAEGICIRLYDQQDFQARPPYTTPELLRSSLAGVILRMKALRLPDIEAFPFLDPPELKRIRDGQALLRELNALDEAGELTGVGRELTHLPLDPRLGRMLVAAKEKGVVHEVLVIAAYLSVQDPRERPMDRQETADQKHRRYADENSDFVSILRLWAHIDTLMVHRKSQRKFRDALKDDFLSPNRVREWRDVYGQLATQVKELGWQVGERLALTSAEGQLPADFANLHQALLTGLLGNIGMLTEEGLYLGARETKFLPFPGSGVKKKPKWVMAAEIVETRRVYARTMARIEPEWIEYAGRHLLRISYSDPHWAKRPAHVAAAMRATLYGLPVVNGRKVHFGPIDPVRAREIFIRAALVEGEFDSRAPFLAHNRRLLEEIEELSHRARNPRLAVDEEALYTWFDDRIPEGIHNGAAFEKWLRDASAKSPKLLHLRREDLLRERGADPRAFPRELDLGGVRFALAYRFDPGTPDDGVTLLVPLAALNQVPAARCDWLVAGLLEEKITALLKGLPQSIRRAFIPVPEFARAATAALLPSPTGGGPGRGTHPSPTGTSPQGAGRNEVAVPSEARDGPQAHRGAGGEGATHPQALTDALTDFLARTTGQAIPRDAWRPETLPPHLTMNYRVIDDDNRVLAEGRDLAELRRQLGAQASRSLQAATAPREREDVNRWDFGDLPERVEVKSGSRQVAAFPALAEEDGQVRLRLIDSPAQARERHRRGVCRLVWLAFPDLLKQTEKDLTARLKPAAMQYALLDKQLNLAALLADVLYSAARGALGDDPADLRGQNAFDSAAQTARPRLAEAARETARLAAECLAHSHRLTQTLARPLPFKEAAADLQAQLKALIFPGFVAQVPPNRLAHLPRYLKAMERRLEKLPSRPERDAQAMRAMAPLIAPWQARRKRELDAGGISPAMEEFRWLLEELRVSLFAQELKTPEPVSVKRLEKRWAEMSR